MNKEAPVMNQSVLQAFSEHKDILISYLAQKLLKPDDIDDLLQETFIQAFRAEKKGPIRSPKSYLFIIARNLLSKQFAKQSKDLVREISDAELSTIANQDSPQELQLHFKMKMETFEKAVSTLPTQCRRVFVLRKIYGMSQKNIANHLDISSSTVERHITIALTKLSETMSAKGYNQSTKPMTKPVVLKKSAGQ